MQQPGTVVKENQNKFYGNPKTEISKFFYFSQTDLGHSIKKFKNFSYFMQQPGTVKKIEIFLYLYKERNL